MCEISGDTRESVNKANKLAQKFVDTCSTQSGCGQTGPVFSSEANKEAEQIVVMVRLSEGKSSRQHSRRSCLDTVQTAREETATVQANIEACVDAFVLASAVHTAAVEHHTDMNAAQRVTTRTS